MKLEDIVKKIAVTKWSGDEEFQQYTVDYFIGKIKIWAKELSKDLKREMTGANAQDIENWGYNKALIDIQKRIEEE